MKGNRNTGKVITAIWLAAIMVTSVWLIVMPSAASADDYHMYGDWNLGASGNDYLTGITGYIDTNGLVEGIAGADYIILTGSFSSYTGHHTAYIYRVETAGDPDMHPDNPYATGPIAPRTFTLVSSQYLGYYGSGHDNAFYVDDTGIYYGATWGGIYHWDMQWNDIGWEVSTSAPSGTQTLARNPNTGDWWVGTAGRALYKWNGSSWVYQFTHPNLAGDHHDGMEIIGNSLFISDMTSDVIIQYRLDASGDAIDPPNAPYGTFYYSTPASRHVEGMGYGANKHIWISGYNSYTIYEMGGGELQIALEGIPDQCIYSGETFDTFDLDDYVVGTPPFSWTYSGNINLSLTVDSENIVTVTYPPGWTGSETIIFTVTDSTGYSANDDTTFKVHPIPIVGDIPDQIIPFTIFDLDDYLSGIDPALVTWSASDPGNGWTADINSDNLVTVTAPDGATEPVTITFTATTTACGREASDSDDAIFTPNRPPDVSEADPGLACLWPPNHKFVEIGIMGVTDPDGDPVTINIVAITSDEPTATDEGSGGAKHAPDASGVGTDTASVRAERSGNGDGRVYVIEFTANDGRGGESEGSVMVKVPHDQSSEDCPAIDSGQDYDATEIN